MQRMPLYSSADAEPKGSHQSSPRSAASLHDAHSEKPGTRELETAMYIAVKDSKPNVSAVTTEPEPEALYSCEDFGLSTAIQLHVQAHNDPVEVFTPCNSSCTSDWSEYSVQNAWTQAE